MYQLTNEIFNRYITDFNDLILDNLTYINTTSSTHGSINVLNNYVKSVTPTKCICYSCIELIAAKEDRKYLKIEFTISYSDFYSVPKLHFRMYNNMDQLLLDMDQWDEYNELLGMSPDNEEYKKDYTFTIETNELLNSTWMSIHPCETLEVVGQFAETSIMEDDKEKIKALKYLSSWFGTYGLTRIFPRISYRPTFSGV
ncbi:uncharacterized protein RJT20DRAFT_129922 [Scheffersomyces xylosifermentans]|uniref:uncharacterized protein n=1 Tax=Scheffersomyces xylosifermentans TaxID=1304137 RepID=UPI00315DA02D